ncbi:hypothetical protein BJ912DRAFT_1058966 [Pholiota molesta]|nr:hypothetical protein BJ912DRAFT_1058966 [Pholiota molesta]
MEAPPAYNSSKGSELVDPQVQDELPPTYTPPTNFKIGIKTTAEPLVSIQQIKGHLALLNAFSELRNSIEGAEISVPYVPNDKERKWAWFVGLAVERFDRWCQGLNLEDSLRDIDVITPPIDVVMVWHSYMLNPRWYMEDSLRIPCCKALKTLERCFRQLLEHPLSYLLFSEPFGKEREHLWESRTTLPFSPFDSMHVLSETVVHCPQSGHPIRVPLMTAEGKGYLQQNFIAYCTRPGCSSEPITKELLAFRKLVKDLCTRSSGAHSSHLPGTLFPLSPSDADKGKKLKVALYESARAKAVKTHALDSYDPRSSEYEKHIALSMMDNGQNLANTRARMTIHTGPLLIPRVMSAYSDNKIYSVELVGAVLRQGSFVQKMFDFGWTKRGYFDGSEDELALHHALARYHAFLDLMSSSMGSFFVPTLDIDLVWHTHQLMSTKYAADCNTYLGRFIDHDDKIEGLRLSSAFDMTCTAWKERFNVQYTYCGCPLPGDTIGKRLSRVVGIYAPPPPVSHLMPFDRPDLLSATHASDHNAVRFQSTNSRAHARATKRYEQLARTKERERQKAAEKARKKAAKAGAVGAALGAGTAHMERRRVDSRDMYNHQSAFLVPIPLYYGPLFVGTGGCVGGGTVVSYAGGMQTVLVVQAGVLVGVGQRLEAADVVGVVAVVAAAAVEEVEAVEEEAVVVVVRT